ncbi:unnamed protein product [Arabidopsis lyrata]|uniref:RING-type domain-containing protein n=1 Tax=Arabidopsis lyrata subsp. lyrata TaxID=81972 RepID=D7KK35_ARALL|nr:E3 ubiquitin-protein ligase RNF38 [Arabidopsis lyrata subsp. lyrata]EFH69439.1 hypothetical protein ARALYDRAFT_889632 [Arabidopsis lyrata subsp. lyrata]CAH8253099.1 unnamed protein product [Arabidopsis lyrata]|eukprot:XP_002893180.1 E3 ubiquitin-protein ligase RNF38 [Arabidopsis lyrata subsp. lyrata]
MEFFADKVSLDHEIDYNPKPEDTGKIKVYASILMSEDPIRDCRTVLEFSLPAKEFWDSFTRYQWEQLDCLEDDEHLNLFQVDSARMELTTRVIDVMFFSVSNSPDCALLFYITFKFSPPPTIEEYFRNRRSLEETTIFEEDMQVPFDESTIRFRPESKFAIESLSRKVYEKATTSCSDICTICFTEFKMGERIVTLPCGHEFDNSCILEWFATNHVCPLCRFELPCEN